jgi:hypothetical protein
MADVNGVLQVEMRRDRRKIVGVVVHVVAVAGLGGSSMAAPVMGDEASVRVVLMAMRLEYQATASLVGSTGCSARQAFMPPWSASTCWKPSLRSCSAARALVCSRGQVQ